MAPAKRSARPVGALVLAPRRDLCLDFANTLAWRGSAPSESLHNLPDVARWCATSGALVAGAIEHSERWTEDHPAEAAALFRNAIALRETLYRIFHAIAGGGWPAEDDLSQLNRALRVAPPRDALEAASGSFGWRVDANAPLTSAPALLAPVLWSAGDLLTAAQLARVRECANDKCLWLFLDQSKNGTRRWCSMSACGNRAKAHRHYARLKGA
ncbi:MAG TPA: ABATE domain-containing protein [Candidatus Binataceae bacterium]|nr:ABATE domain-containing protein [Candidatus Binataceae bacterium]